MKTWRLTLTSVVAILALAALVRAADPSGRWTATFTTEVGEQQYTFEFKVKGSALTGTAKSNLLGESELQEGKVDGDKISFTVTFDFGGMTLDLSYTGVVSASEIKMTGDFMGMPFEFTVKKA